MWKPPERNLEKVQHEYLRKQIDHKFNKLHDELSDAYYNGKRFKNGTVDIDFATLKQTDPTEAKRLFDEIHATIHWSYDLEFYNENQKRASKDKIPEDKYNEVKDFGGNLLFKKSEVAAAKIAEVESKGIKLVV